MCNQEKKINFLPADFKQKIRQKRKAGLLVIYPWSNEFKEKLDPKKDIYMGWQVIIPPTRREDEDVELIFDQDCNQAAREARNEKLRIYLIQIYFHKFNEFVKISKKLDDAWNELLSKRKEDLKFEGEKAQIKAYDRYWFTLNQK